MKLRARPRRGQSEVVGGLIVLTLLFLFAVPVILNVYYANIKAGQEARLGVAETLSKLNEKISIGPLDPNSPAAVQGGWQIGVWINNTGTTSVTLDKLYLVDYLNNTLFAVLDLRYARPDNNTYIRAMFIDFEQGAGQEPPPAGEPIVLGPGQTLLIIFNETLLPAAPYLVALVESDNGLLHPLVGGGAPKPIYPGRPSKLAGAGAWRGIFAPQSGFSLRGYDELTKTGIAYAWRPPLHVYPVDRYGYLTDIDYDYSFIYEDPNYPGLYMLDIGVDETVWLRVVDPNGGVDTYKVKSGYTIKVYGFVGTYDAGGNGYGTYFNGYAFRVEVLNTAGTVVYSAEWDEPVMLDDDSITRLDFDGNGIDELAVYSYLNGPNVDTKINIDADGDGSTYRDALAWTYMVARDISGIDFIKITVKINYYWTTVFVPGNEPDWEVRRLKVFAIVVWKYDPGENKWEVYQYKNFGYTSEKPVQFQQTAVFPVEYNGTYRVGVIFYDNYRDFDYAFNTWTDFTLSLEHIIVEYGVHNPLFVESPPLYIIAIPDADLIGDIGEVDYALSHNLSDLDQAKVLAQADLLAKIKSELNYAGIAGYTIITNPQDFCNLLFSDQPPKYAVIYWLQGNVSMEDVALEAGCTLSSSDIKDYMETYHWILVWPFGEPFGDRTKVVLFNSGVTILPEGNYTLNITKQGLTVRKEYYAYFLFNSALFQYAVKFIDGDLLNASLIPEATFYANGTINESSTIFGTIAFWLDTGEGTGAIVLNPVHIDWDYTRDGVSPDTLAQQIVYASAIAWTRLVSS